MPDERTPTHLEPEGHPPPPPPKPEGVPPHIIQELLELREKVGKLEGMLEILLLKKD